MQLFLNNILKEIIETPIQSISNFLVLFTIIIAYYSLKHTINKDQNNNKGCC